ncbi:JmjC-domain-containing protein [Scenedesmus sp. NREL 46B-D3]|nr:JmjC-domain-containing protein [Scenedesmus sp. NREL 46B-D3]
MARWRPDAGRVQVELPAAPTFRPTAEEFADPFGYIMAVYGEIAKQHGVCRIVPPEGWAPPAGFPLQQSMQFAAQRQFLSHLCMRQAPPVAAAGGGAERQDSSPDEQALLSKQQQQQQQQQHGELDMPAAHRMHSLRSLAAYAGWAARVHFSSQPRRTPSRSSREPSIEQVEAELWRIVERPDAGRLVETLTCQDLDSSRFGSGFALPAWRRLPCDPPSSCREPSNGPAAAAAAEQAAGAAVGVAHVLPPGCWNLNSMPRRRGSMLRHLPFQQPLPGVLLPRVQLDSCLAVSSWHCEQQGMYSLQYMHSGAPKVWYAVPGHACEAFEVAVADCLPHLAVADPLLLARQPVAVSPNELSARGLPVSRLVQEAGSFVLSLPGAYTCSIACGFSVSEGLRLAPWDWLGHGTDACRKARLQRRRAALSMDQLLVALAAAVAAAAAAAAAAAEAQAAAAAAAVEGSAGQPDSAAAAAAGCRVRCRLGCLLGCWCEAAQRAQARGDGCCRRAGLPDAAGCHTDTAGCVCEACRCDLWLSAVVSSAAPGRTVCAEHAAALAAPPASCSLLFRHSIEELQRLVFEVAALFPGVEQHIKAAQQRLRQRPWMRVKSLGPVGDAGQGSRRRAAPS